MNFRQSVKFTALVLIFLFSFKPAFSHSCATFKNLNDKEYAEKLAQVDAILFGEVISSKYESDYIHIIEMRVLKTWKGLEKTKIKIKFSNPCSYDSKSSLQIGAKLMIYGYSIKDSELIGVDCCNFGLFDDERMKKIYGEGKVIEQPEPSPTPSESTKGFWASLWEKITSFFS